MEEQPAGHDAPANGPTEAKDRVDRMPSTPEEWAAFAALPAADRSAAYLRSIRSMLLFFTVLVIAGLVGVMVTVLSRHG